MPSDQDRPRLRPVEAIPVQTDGGKMVALRDPSGIAKGMVVLSQDLFSIEAKDIPKTEVLFTILGGKVVYKKNSSE